MARKKDYPLEILKALEGFVSLNGNQFELVDSGEFIMKAIDKDPKSSFHFILETYQTAAGAVLQVLMNMKPRSQKSIGENRTWINVNDLNGHFNSWLSLLSEYDAVKSFFDDPAVKAFSDEFYAEFELLEDDADVKPLNTKQILFLDEYLEKTAEHLSNHITEKNSDQIEDIQSDITILRDSLTTKSKKWVATNLAKVWAKIAKQGPKFIKEFLSEVKTEVIKVCVKGAIELAQNNFPVF